MIKKILKKAWDFFFKFPDRPLKWYEVILWWEFRRIPYNILVLISGFISLLAFASFVKGWYHFLSPPLFVFGIFILGANVFYTGGWILEYIIKFGSNEFSRKLGVWSFKYGLFFALLVTWLPTLVSFYTFVKTGEASSPYAKFTKTTPNYEDITGHYDLAEDYIDWYMADGIYDMSGHYIELNPDSSFFIKNMAGLVDSFSYNAAWNSSFSISGDSAVQRIFDMKKSEEKQRTLDSLLKTEKARYFKPEFTLPPHYNYDLDKCRLFDASGRWTVRKSLNDNWVLIMKFDSAWASDPDYHECYRGFQSVYNLQNEKPPYNIYIIQGDPDSWQAHIYNQVIDTLYQFTQP